MCNCKCHRHRKSKSSKKKRNISFGRPPTATINAKTSGVSRYYNGEYTFPDQTSVSLKDIYNVKDNPQHSFLECTPEYGWDKKGTFNNFSLTNIQSIQINKGLSLKITDDKNNSMMFYHDVYFIDAFGFTKDSVITSVTVDYVNPPCSINNDIEEFMLSPALITLIVSLFCTFTFLMVASSLSR